MDSGIRIIFASIIVEIILGIIGPYWYTCGIGFSDFLILISSVIPILLYQKFKEGTKFIKWIIVAIGSGLNIFWGIMFLSVIC